MVSELVRVLSVVLLVTATLAPGAHAQTWVNATFLPRISIQLATPGHGDLFCLQGITVFLCFRRATASKLAPCRVLYLEEPRSHRGLPPAPCPRVHVAPIIAPIIASPRPPLFFKRRLCQDADGLQMNFTAVRTGPSGNQPRVAFDRSQCSLIVQPCSM